MGDTPNDIEALVDQIPDTLLHMTSTSRRRTRRKRSALAVLAYIAAVPLGAAALEAGAGGAFFLPLGAVVVGALLFWPRRGVQSRRRAARLLDGLEEVEG